MGHRYETKLKKTYFTVKQHSKHIFIDDIYLIYKPDELLKPDVFSQYFRNIFLKIEFFKIPNKCLNILAVLCGRLLGLCGPHGSLLNSRVIQHLLDFYY